MNVAFRVQYYQLSSKKEPLFLKTCLHEIADKESTDLLTLYKDNRCITAEHVTVNSDSGLLTGDFISYTRNEDLRKAVPTQAPEVVLTEDLDGITAHSAFCVYIEKKVIAVQKASGVTQKQLQRALREFTNDRSLKIMPIKDLKISDKYKSISDIESFNIALRPQYDDVSEISLLSDPAMEIGATTVDIEFKSVGPEKLKRAAVKQVIGSFLQGGTPKASKLLVTGLVKLSDEERLETLDLVDGKLHSVEWFKKKENVPSDEEFEQRLKLVYRMSFDVVNGL